MNTSRRLGIGLVPLLLLAAPTPAGAFPPVQQAQYRSYGDPNYDGRGGYDPGYNRGYDNRGYDNRGGYDSRDGYDRRGDDRRGDNGGYNGRNGGGVPGGSYLASCGNARMEGSSLVAICRGRRGERFQTVLDTSRCGQSDVGNDNGTLRCSGARGSSRRMD